MSNPITIAYTAEYLDWTGSKASPIRAKHAVALIVEESRESGIPVTILTPTLDWDAVGADLAVVHDVEYVEAIRRGERGESGHNRRQGEVAAIMFQGTVDLVAAMEADAFARRVYFNPQGAKHHAQFDTSSGFCVFNDMAWAAHHFAAQGKRVAYLDWDIHHGDGVENLTRSSSSILTASIHEWGIFPGTGYASEPANEVYNWALPRYADDGMLLDAIDEAVTQIEAFRPDVLLLACGADGLANDLLSSAQYTFDGIARAARAYGELAARLDVPVLIGGAGGYQPDDETPQAWAITVAQLHAALTEVAQPVA